MANDLDNLLQFHAQALNLRATRQQLLASNIANADTPNLHAGKRRHIAHLPARTRIQRVQYQHRGARFSQRMH